MGAAAARRGGRVGRLGAGTGGRGGRPGHRPAAGRPGRGRSRDSGTDAGMLITTGEIVAAAQASGAGVAAFNVITLEHAEAIAAAAESTGLPAILQISQNAVRFHGSPRPIAAACAAVARVSSAELSLHLDHVDDVGLLHAARACQASSVMFDASALDDAANIAATGAAARWAHANGLWIEAELGAIGGKA